MKNLKGTSALITKAASLFIVIAGCLVLAGWFFGIEAFKSILPGIISIKFNTAVCFILSGATLYLLDAPAFSLIGKKIAVICACIVLVISILTLAEYIFRWNLGIDELLWREGTGTIGTTFPGRMSENTALNFTLLGFIFLMLGRKKYHWPIQILLVAMIPWSLLVIINYVFGISFLSSVQLLNATALHTAILFIVLCIGVFFSSVLGYPQFSFLKKIAGFFVLIFLVRSIIFFAINKNNALAADMDKRLEFTNQVLFMVLKINAQANELQSNVRGYVISDEENFSLLVGSTADSIVNMIGRLKVITKNDEDQRLRVDTLEKNLKTYIAFEEELINTRLKEGLDAAKQTILYNKGTFLLNNVHANVASIEKDESQLLAERKAKNEQSIRNSSRIFNTFQFLVGFLLLAAIKMIYDNTRFRNKVEVALQDSLKDISDYKHALDESSIIVIADQNGIIKQVNDNFCKISKFTREEIIGQDHFFSNSGYHPKEFMNDLWETIKKGKIWRGEIKNKAKDGTCYWLDTTIVPFLDEHGKPYQYVAIRSDITQRKKLEDEIKQFNLDLKKRVEEKTKEVIEKEQQYRFLLQNMRESIQVIGYDWRYIFVNRSAVAQSKYSDQELLGHTIMEKYPGIENSDMFKVFQCCMKDRTSRVLESEFTFPDATTGWFELSIQPVSEGLFILSMDISERKKAEDELRESFNRYELVNKATQDTIWEWDMNTNEVKRNNIFTTLYGYTNDQINKDHNWTIEKIHPADKEKVIKNIKNCVENNLEYWQDEYRFRAADGSYKNVYDRAFVQFNEAGRPYRMIGAMTDLTDKKKLEEELAEQSLKQQKLLMEVAIQSQEKEKNEMGRELHDNVNQILATVKMYLNMAGSGKYVAHDLVAISYNHVTEAMDEIRKLSHSLVAPSLGDLSLKEALEHLLAENNLLNKLKVHLEVDKKFDEQNMDKNKELMIYRIVQEQLTNINKHAKAKEIVISLKIENGYLFLSASDDGIGFDTAYKGNGIGLRNISSRVAFYSGTMNIISAPGEGCTLEVCIPY